jgi:hypothetical protein
MPQIVISLGKKIMKCFEQSGVLLNFFLRATSTNVYIFWRVLSANIYFISFLQFFDRHLFFQIGNFSLVISCEKRFKIGTII